MRHELTQFPVPTRVFLFCSVEGKNISSFYFQLFPLHPLALNDSGNVPTGKRHNHKDTMFILLAFTKHALNALSHGAIFLATCNAMLLLRDVNCDKCLES